MACNRKPASCFLLMFYVAVSSGLSAQPNQQGSYTPPKQIEEALKTFAGRFGDDTYRCSKAAQDEVFSCTILHECGLAAVAFRQNQIELIHDGSALNKRCTKDMFVLHINLLLQLFLDVTQAKAQEFAANLTRDIKAVREPNSNRATWRSGAVTIENGLASVDFASYDTGIEQFGFQWVSSKLQESR